MFLTIWSASLFARISAQPVPFTPEDFKFFQQKAETYQAWLDKIGLGTVLRVMNVRLKKENTELELLLHINSSDLDTAIALWNHAKDDYRLIADRPLEEQLFQTFVAFMEIPPAQGNVQVYVLDEGGILIPCFYVGIWEEDGNVRQETKLREQGQAPGYSPEAPGLAENGEKQNCATPEGEIVLGDVRSYCVILAQSV